MDQLFLADHEVSYYFDLCDTYDPAKQGKVPSEHAINLFKRANLPSHILSTIVRLCGASNQTHFNRTQFFTALKLISLAQKGHEVTMDALRLHGRTLPLPTFANSKPTDIKFVPQSPSSSSSTPENPSDSSNQNALQSAVLDDTGTLSEISTPFSTDNSSDNDWCPHIRKYMNLPPTTKPKWTKFEAVDNQTIPKTKESNKFPDRQSSSDNEDVTWHPNEKQTNQKPIESKNNPYALLTGADESIGLDQQRLGATNFNQFHESAASSFMSENRIIDILPHRPPQMFGDNKLSTTIEKFAGLSVHSTDQPNQLRFWLHPSEENEYATQFDNLLSLSERNNTNPSLSLARVRSHFSTHYHISNTKVDEIWRLADLDRDSRLNKAEFCLASHLAHLHGHERLSINDAVSATASYIAERIPKLGSSHRDLPASGRLLPSTQQPSPSHLATKANGCSSPELVDYGDEEKLISQPDSGHTETATVLPNLRVVASMKNSSSSSLSSPESCSVHSSSAAASSRSDSKALQSSSFDSSTSPSDEDSERSFDIDFLPGQSGLLLNDGNKRKHRHCDAIHLLAATLNRTHSSLRHLSVNRRRKLLNALIREAKNVNHSLLRLNNELHGEWAELNDQRVNISAQLQHLGLLPSTD